MALLGVMTAAAVALLRTAHGMRRRGGAAVVEFYVLYLALGYKSFGPMNMWERRQRQDTP